MRLIAPIALPGRRQYAAKERRVMNILNPDFGL